MAVLGWNATFDVWSFTARGRGELDFNQDSKNQVSAETVDSFQAGNQEIKLSGVLGLVARHVVEKHGLPSSFDKIFWISKTPRESWVFRENKSKKSNKSNALRQLRNLTEQTYERGKTLTETSGW